MDLPPLDRSPHEVPEKSSSLLRTIGLWLFLFLITVAAIGGFLWWEINSTEAAKEGWFPKAMYIPPGTPIP